jgi:LPS-assembly lipoprotein
MENPSEKSLSCRARSSTSWSDRSRAGSQWLALAMLLLVAPALASCGFTPLYAERGAASVSADLSALDVRAPDTKLGRELKYNLLDLLSGSGNPPSNPAYVVELAPTVYDEDLAIERDADVTRKNMVMVVPFRLVDTATNKIVMRSTARSRSSYNRVDSEFANIVAAQDAERRIARAIADDIKLQLSIHFDRQARAGG